MVVSSPMTAKAFLLNHLEALSEFYDVTLIANFSDENAGINLPEGLNVKFKNVVIARNISLIGDLICLFRLGLYFRKNRFDLVHSITPKAGLLSMIAACVSRVPNRVHIFTGQIWATHAGIRRCLYKNIDRAIYRCSTETLIDGSSQRAFLVAQNVLEKDKSRVLGHGSISGVDTEKFKQSAENYRRIRNEFKIPNEATLFMFLGRMNIDKGLLDLFEAFEIVRKKTHQIYLMVVGPIENDVVGHAITDLICRHPEAFIHIDYTNTPQMYMQSADVFCLPSYREGFGTSVLEAASCGVPAICSDVYGLKDTVVDNETGYFHKVKNPASISQFMELFLEQNELSKLMGARARSRVMQKFSSTEVSDEWVRFYKEILH